MMLGALILCNSSLQLWIFFLHFSIINKKTKQYGGIYMQSCVCYWPFVGNALFCNYNFRTVIKQFICSFIWILHKTFFTFLWIFTLTHTQVPKQNLIIKFSSECEMLAMWLYEPWIWNTRTHLEAPFISPTCHVKCLFYVLFSTCTMHVHYDWHAPINKRKFSHGNQHIFLQAEETI